MIKDRTGQTINGIVAVRFIDVDKHQNARWQFKCHCGGLFIVRANDVFNNRTHSCGCLRGTGRRSSPIIRTSEELAVYHTWLALRQRCNNPNHSSYENYGGRGIKVCSEWNNFTAFYKVMGPKPSKDHSINRINNDGDYTPENCHWATRKEQNSNKRNSR